MENRNIIQKAIEKAIALHAGQKRKGDGSPYVVHPLEVGFIVARYLNHDEIIAAAMLHDTLEDCDYAIEELTADFGESVAGLVSCLTENKQIKDWASRKAENLERIKANKAACYIKAADCLANMQSLIVALKTEGTVVWSRFNAPKNLKINYFACVLGLSKDVISPELLERYVSALKDLEYSDSFVKSGIGFTAEE